MMRGIRGATTVTQNSSEEILDRTENLIREMIQKNSLHTSNIASVLISVTEDITAEFPAKALRRVEGFTYVPVMCMKEIPVPNSLSFCIRVMMMVNTDMSAENIKHIYQEMATILRPDLVIDK
jgi:chorismate mutase